MIMDYEKSELAARYLGQLPREGFIPLMNSMYKKGNITSKHNLYSSDHLGRMQDMNPEGLVQTSPMLGDPRRKNYYLSSLGEEIYEAVQEYRPEIDRFERVLNSFADGRAADWTEFIFEAEEDDIVTDILDVHAETRAVYIDDAENLGMLELEKSGGIWSISEVTEKGETVQEFIAEIGEAVSEVE
jgi:predicted transcriptional regulator